MIRLKLASCMAEDSESFCHAVARYIDDQLGVPTDYVTGIPWQERHKGGRASGVAHHVDCHEVELWQRNQK
jgi:hypothetical protein